MAFARLWSLKEAYLKARGTGVSREPSRFLVRFAGAERATITDPLGDDGAVAAATVWRQRPDGWAAAVSAVALASPGRMNAVPARS